jgi:prophage lp2 protein 6
MNLKDLIKQLAEKINQQKESILTEEVTKNAFIMQG